MHNVDSVQDCVVEMHIWNWIKTRSLFDVYMVFSRRFGITDLKLQTSKYAEPGWGHILRHRISDRRMTPKPRTEPADQGLIDLDEDHGTFISDMNLMIPHDLLLTRRNCASKM